MALLNQTKYKNPQAQILYGAGNPNISRDDIRSYVAANLTTGKDTPLDYRNALLGNNVSLKQLSEAMSDNPAYSLDKLENAAGSLGISKETETIPDAVQYQPILRQANVVPERIELNPRTDTVEGRVAGIVSDPNSPLNVQAQTFANQLTNKRGLLNSSLNTSAAQDAMYRYATPIAAQDATTSYDAKRTNSAQGMQAGMFNADLASKVDMFNADQALRGGMFNQEIGRDYAKMDLDRFTANLDANTRLDVATMQSRATETGIMGDLSRNFMDLYTKIAGDPNMNQDAKREAVINLQSMYSTSVGLLDTFSGSANRLANVFGSANNSNNGGGGAGGGGSNNSSGGSVNNANSNLDPSGLSGGGNIPVGAIMQRSDGAKAFMPMGSAKAPGAVFPKDDGNGYIVKAKQGLRPVNIDTSTYVLSATDKLNLSALEQSLGRSIDPKDVVPEELILSIQRNGLYLGDSYAPIPYPGSLRGDNIILNIWRAALPKYQ